MDVQTSRLHKLLSSYEIINDLTKEDYSTYMLPIVHAVNLFFEFCFLHLDKDNNNLF